MMTKTTVVKIRDVNLNDPDVVRIDRETKWGNPFVMEREADRQTVIVQYREWIQTQPDLLAALPELKGKRLACWCAPKSCHGDVLAELADSDP